MEQVVADLSHNQAMTLKDGALRATPDARSIQAFARTRRFLQALWTEMGRIPEYHDQAERLTRTLRRKT